MKLSLGATLFAVGLEILSTCEFAQETIEARDMVDMLEVAVVIWFTFEYALRVHAHGLDYAFSWLGVVDFLATFPFYLATGLFGASIASIRTSMMAPFVASEFSDWFAWMSTPRPCPWSTMLSEPVPRALECLVSQELSSSSFSIMGYTSPRGRTRLRARISVSATPSPLCSTPPCS